MARRRASRSIRTPRNFSRPPVFGSTHKTATLTSDGESRGTNRRVAVIDPTGTFLRQWQPEGMESVHCLIVDRDGLVYVCNREGSRIQVYDKMGHFIKNIEAPWKPVTPPPDGKPKQSGGSAVALALSRDSNETFMYMINQNTAEIEILDRHTGKVLSKPGCAGHFRGSSTRLGRHRGGGLQRQCSHS